MTVWKKSQCLLKCMMGQLWKLELWFFIMFISAFSFTSVLGVSSPVQVFWELSFFSSLKGWKGTVVHCWKLKQYIIACNAKPEITSEVPV